MTIHKTGYTVLAVLLGFYFSVPIYLSQGRWYIWPLCIIFYGIVFLLTKLKISNKG